jgi:hypothetical protein
MPYIAPAVPRCGTQKFRADIAGIFMLAFTKAGTSGKLQSKRIFNAVDMLVQIAD